MKPATRSHRNIFLSAVAIMSIYSTTLFGETKTSSYSPVVVTETLQSTMKRMKEAKPAIEKEHKTLLEERYDLSDHPSKSVKMTGGKPVQEGIRVKLPKGMDWDKLAGMAPEAIQEKGLFPQGFMPLPHPNHNDGGMVFQNSKLTKSKNRKTEI